MNVKIVDTKQVRKEVMMKSFNGCEINYKRKGVVLLKKYSIIYADPPWKHTSWGNGNRRPELHYPVMDLEEICNLPIHNMSADDCTLFLWTTPPHIQESFEVIKAWGFTYKTFGFTWIKRNKKSEGIFMGCGSWTRANAEVCLLATKGKPKRMSASVRQVIISPREEHSKKPDEIRGRIVDLLGELPRVELFAREKTDGWDSWGNEIFSDINLYTD